MDHPLPVDTQQKLLRLCSIYTQEPPSESPPSQELSGQTVYTLESLHERLSCSKRPASGQRPKAGCATPGALPGRTEAGQEQLGADVLAERARELRGSPWQVCTGEEEEEEGTAAAVREALHPQQVWYIVSISQFIS